MIATYQERMGRSEGRGGAYYEGVFEEGRVSDNVP